MGVEGADHSGADTRRLGTRQANTLGLFRMEIAESATSLEAGLLSDSYDTRVRKAFTSILYSLENEVIRGKWNAANSLGTATTTRTLKGIKTFLTTINSAITASSFAANPHLYIGDAWEQAWSQGANVGTETWGIVAGSTFFRNLSDLNDTKVSDSNEREEFKRVIRRYTGPFGTAELFLGRTLDVLLDEKTKGETDKFLGRTGLDAPEVDGTVYVSGKNLKVGDLYRVKIAYTLEYDLIGEVVE